MNKHISLIFILIFSCLNLSAQTEKYTAPVNWERYKVSSREVSIMLPKLPVVIDSSDYCNETEAATYIAYAEETAYKFRIASKSKEKIPDDCTEKNKFGQKSFESVIKRLKSEQEGSVESKLTINEREVFKVSGKHTTYWVFNDLKNNKWIELSVTHRDDIMPKSERFTQSLVFAKNPSGTEIRDGALQTLGDESEVEIKSSENAKQKAETEKTDPMMLVAKPRANYTDVARQAQAQGTVSLRVTFLANGGIGSISPISGLGYGLTEQAIAAAGKLVFLPMKRNGVSVTVTKQVQYSFTIY